MSESSGADAIRATQTLEPEQLVKSGGDFRFIAVLLAVALSECAAVVLLIEK